MNENTSIEQSLISIIVPVYKVEKYLNQCIESICGQTYQNLEIILIDDGSPDNCPMLCDQWQEKDNRILVIHKKNGGLSDARNTGMQIATGEYIGFVDSDDWISPEMYERLLYAILKDNSDISCCAVEMFWDNTERKEYLNYPQNVLLDRMEAQAALLKETILKQPVWYRLYKHDLIQSLLFEKGKQHEDVFWSYQAIGLAKRVSVVDYVGYHYRQRKDSIMGASFSLKNLDGLEAVCKRHDYFKQEFPELSMDGLISIWRNCIYYGQMVLLYLSGEDREKAWCMIREIRRKYPLKVLECRTLDIKQQMWIYLSMLSLPLTSRIKNMLRIGF